MNRAIDSASAGERGVGGVHDRIGWNACDIAALDSNPPKHS